MGQGEGEGVGRMSKLVTGRRSGRWEGARELGGNKQTGCKTRG